MARQLRFSALIIQVVAPGSLGLVALWSDNFPQQFCSTNRLISATPLLSLFVEPLIDSFPPFFSIIFFLNGMFCILFQRKSQKLTPWIWFWKQGVSRISPFFLLHRIVSGLLTEVHKEIPCLNSLVTSIGNLDMITSFALISRHPDYGTFSYCCKSYRCQARVLIKEHPSLSCRRLTLLEFTARFWNYVCSWLWSSVFLLIKPS